MLVLIPPYKKKLLAEIIASGNDPYFANTIVQLHMDGTNGSQTFTNIAGRAMRVYGTAQISTAQSKFGGGSYLSASGAALSVSAPDSTFFNPAAGDFTMEAWVYRKTATLGTVMGNYRHRIGYRGGCMLQVTAAGALRFANGDQTTITIISTDGQIPINTWTHVAISRNGTSWRLFVNGQMVANVTATATVPAVDGVYAGAAGTVDEGPFDFRIGYYPSDVSITAPFDGYIDEVRYTKGVGRYNANFAPAGSAFLDIGINDDLNYPSVVLLMHMDGANNGTTFIDEKGHAVTRSGTPVTSTATPLTGTASAVFARSTPDYLSIAASTDFQFAGDFTIELTFQLTLAAITNNAIIGNYVSNTTGHWYLRFQGANSLAWYVNGTGVIAGSAGTLVLGQTYRVAMVRSGSTCTLYLDGVALGQTGTYSGVFGLSTLPIIVGARGTGAEPQSIIIDELRITNGVARYTGTYVPATTAFPSTFDPDYSKVLLLLHGEGANAGTAIVDQKGHTITNSGVTTSTAQFKVGKSSMLFNGSRLIFPPTSDFAFGTGDFTVEGWFYQTSEAAYSTVLEIGDESSVNGVMFMLRPSGGGATLYCGSFSIATPCALNQWNHVAWVRQSGVLKIYVNGVANGSQAFTNNLNSLTFVTVGGDQHYGGHANYLYKGHIDEMRVTSGLARYTANFTPTIVPFPEAEKSSGDVYANGVKSLLHFDGTNGSTSIVESTPSARVWTTGTGATLATAQKKFGVSSLAINGATTANVRCNDATFAPGTQDFTIEGWAYFSAFVGTASGIFHLGTNSSYLGAPATSLAVGLLGSSGFQMYAGNTNTNSTGVTPALNTWYHYALVRTAGTTKLYINGVQVASVADTVNYVGAYMSLGQINGIQYTMNGYLDDFRYTIGVARYVANFTPPTSAYPDAV